MIKNTITVLALAAFAHLPAYAETPFSTVAQVDVARYSGQWYEIARLPMRFQAQCVADVSANYRVNDNGSIAVTNRCRQADGSWDQAEGLARAEDSSNSRLRVTFLPKGLRWLPFGKAPYWIMALDSNYQTTMVASPAAAICGCCRAHRRWMTRYTKPICSKRKRKAMICRP